MKKISFDAVIEEGRRGGALVRVPVDVRSTFGTGGQVKVRAVFDGHPYRGLLAPMGNGQHVLGVTREVRSAIGKDLGDTVRVRLEVDSEPRVVEIPPDLMAALAARPELLGRFQDLSYTHRKEYVSWIVEAKRPETRERRVEKALRMLEEGRTR